MAPGSGLRMPRPRGAGAGSEGPSPAVRAAIRLATPPRARVEALGIVPKIPEVARHPEAARALMERIREDTKTSVNTPQAAVAEAGLEAGATVLEGHPAGELRG